MSLFCAGHLLLGMACPSVWFVYPVRRHWGKPTFPGPPVSFSIRDVRSCLLSLAAAGPVCAVIVSVSAYVHQSCCLWTTVSVVLSVLFGSYNLSVFPKL